MSDSKSKLAAHRSVLSQKRLCRWQYHDHPRGRYHCCTASQWTVDRSTTKMKRLFVGVSQNFEVEEYFFSVKAINS